MFNAKLISLVNEIITKASLFGLPQKDVDIAKEYVEHNEYGIAVEHVTDQLFESDIQIDLPFYHSVLSVADKLEMDRNLFDSLKKLIEE